MKKFISALIAGLFFSTMLSSLVVIADENENPFNEGNGTSMDPFQITTIEQLDSIRNYLDCCFVLMNDLDFTNADSYEDSNNIIKYITGDGWKPIGGYKEGAEFTGSFNGQGFTISNLFVNQSFAHYSSLFGKIVDAEIFHLILDDVYVKGTGFIGGIAGNNEQGEITDCTISGFVDGSSLYIGGLVGRNNGSIDNCHVSTLVSGDLYVGGLVGLNKGCIFNSSASEDVNGNDYKSEIRNIGGLVGGNLGSISDSFATGNVTGNSYVGGLAGGNWQNISDCYATGKVTSVWHNHGNITLGRRYVGRLTGANFGSVTDSYATGKVAFRGYSFGILYHLITHIFADRFFSDDWSWWLKI